MQIVTKIIAPGDTPWPLGNDIPRENALYIDLETTGLSAQHDQVYLIGCAFYEDNNWTLTQWFDNKGDGERDLLVSFLAFARSYPVWIHYNGDRFDMPFLIRRIAENHLNSPIESVRSIDLFKVIRPYRQLLGLADYKQQTVEAFMQTGRKEDTDGGDLVRVYRDYLAATTAKSDQRTTLLAHNEADVLGIIKITPIVELSSLMDTTLSVRRAQANYYKGVDGNEHQELILFAIARNVPEDTDITSRIVTSADDCYLDIEGNKVTIRIPLIQGELKYYYANYKDYYYLPAEDQAMHKSIATYVDPSRRQQAKAENCYTRKSGSFLPEWDQFRSPFFKKEYRDKTAYFELKPEMKKDKQFFCEYADYVFRHILGK